MSDVVHTDTPQRLLAIEVDSSTAWEAICALQPHYKELDPVANGGNFVIVSSDDPKLEGAILSPGTVAEHFDHIEPSSHRIKFVEIVR